MRVEVNQQNDKFGLMPTVTTEFFGGDGGGGGGGVQAASGNMQLSYSGTLIDSRSDGIITLCTYSTPGGGAYTLSYPGNAVCPANTPAPGGYASNDDNRSRGQNF